MAAIIWDVGLVWLQVLQCIANYSIKHQSFIFTELNGQTVRFLSIQFSISPLLALNSNIKQIYSKHG